MDYRMIKIFAKKECTTTRNRDSHMPIKIRRVKTNVSNNKEDCNRQALIKRKKIPWNHGFRSYILECKKN